MIRSRPTSRPGRARTAGAALCLICLTPLAAQEVTLPLARFEELRALASPEPAPAPEPPAPLAFEEAALTVAVGEASARITQELTLAVYGDGWRRARLGESGSFVAADLGAAEGRLTGRTIELRGAGRHRLRVVSVVPVTIDETAARPTWRLRWQAPRAALVHGTLETPPAIVSASAQGAVVEAAGEGRWSFVAIPGAEVTLTLEGEAAVPERASLPLALDATSAVALEVARSRRRATGWLEVRVRQGRLERLAVPLPEGFEVIAVTGDPIAGWDVTDGRWLVTPLAALTDTLRLEVEMAAGAAAELTGPVLVPEGAAHVLAATKVRVTGDGLLELLGAGAGRQVDARLEGELPRAFSALSGLALALPRDGAPPRYSVSWPDRTEVLAAQVDRLLVDVVAGDAGRASYQLWAEVRNRGVERLTLGLPPGAELIDARRDGRPLTPGSTAEGWTVSLAAGDARQVIYLSALLPLRLPAEGELEVPLPRLSAPIARVEARLSLPGGRRYTLVDAGRLGAVKAPPPTPAPGAAGFAELLGGAAPPEAAGAGELFGAPPGFRVVEAAWSALVREPEPLRLRVDGEPDKRRWF